MAGQCSFKCPGNCSTVMPSMPGLPLLDFTRLKACTQLSCAQTSSISCSWLLAGLSNMRSAVGVSDPPPGAIGASLLCSPLKASRSWLFCRLPLIENRAVTLATEASNGTLNASQDTAANQEYQSILSEISNIGSTTTYNNQTVFGVTKDIYTGDSSTQGASINSLNIRSLSSSNVGDSGGVMAYSNGQGNVFINLSSSSKNAQSTDTLNSGPGGSTINVNYLVKGANGSENTATSSITVGGTSGYANTADGLISAINIAGLGLTASFTTQSQAGVVGGGTQIGRAWG